MSIEDSKKPIIFCHYGNSPYLYYTLKQVKLTNPQNRIILLGDQDNKKVANKAKIEHYCFKDYDEGLEYAKEQNLPMLIDFTGHSCVNCRKVEEHTWSVPEVKKLLSEVDLFIGNDSGPAHIAAAVGTNTITIFGSTDVKHGVKFTPYKGNHEYLKAVETILCSPCYKSKCPTKMECMNSITVEHVMKKINLLFKIKGEK